MAERVEGLIERTRARDARKARRSEVFEAIALVVWIVGWPAFVWWARGGVATSVGCLPPDPDGGMLRDSEPCRGDTWALVRVAAVPLVVWLLGVFGIVLVALVRSDRRSASRV